MTFLAGPSLKINWEDLIENTGGWESVVGLTTPATLRIVIESETREWTGRYSIHVDDYDPETEGSPEGDQVFHLEVTSTFTSLSAAQEWIAGVLGGTSFKTMSRV